MSLCATHLLKSMSGKLATFRKPANYYGMPVIMTLATKSNLLIRRSSEKEMEFATREAVKAGRSIGPYDYLNAFAFDPKGFLVGVLDGKVVCHYGAVTYPNHHSFMCRMLVAEQHRKKGFANKLLTTTLDRLDKLGHTIGGDSLPAVRSKLESHGFETYWNTYIATLSLDKIARILAGINPPPLDGINIVTQPIHEANREKILDYDSKVFGTPRHMFIERWMSSPGSFGWVAINQASDNAIVGYSILKLDIRRGGTEIGLAMTPLFADNVHIARLLLKTAADSCLANKALPKTKLQLFHPVGDNCGEDAAQLMQELEAELTLFAFRMYTKGIPLGRQMKKIYGIASPTFG